MSPVRVIIIVIAAVAAIGLAFVLRGALGGKPEPVVATAGPEKPSTRVLVAKRDLAVGARIQAEDLGWQDWPADALNASFITDGSAPTPPSEKPKGVEKAAAAAGEMIGGAAPMQAWVGALVREPILTGEPLMARKLVRAGEGGFMSVVLAPGKRALAVAVTVESGAGGFVLPGDRVDVLQSHDAEAKTESEGDSGSKVVVETILTNVRVLAIDQATQVEKDAKSIIGSTATLEVNAQDAEALMRAKGSGSLVLALRPLEESGAYSGVPGGGGGGDGKIVRVHRAGAISTVGVPR
jgi:pilus assembly protein CpaB